jgi:hypothetical protein
MDLNSLPVDNLYKFAALSGVALVAFLLWLDWNIRRELTETFAELQTKQARSSVAAKRLERLQKIDDAKLALIDKELERFRKLESSGTASGGELQKQKDQLKALYTEQTKTSMDRLEEQYRVQVDQEELAAALDGLRLRLSAFRRQRRQYAIAITASVLWSAVGFSLWYVRLQKFQDDKLRLDTEVTTLELEIKRSALQSEKARQVAAPETTK